VPVHFNITAAFLEKSHYRPIYAGDDYDYGFRVIDAAGNPYDLTDCVINFTVAKAYGAAPVLAFSSTNQLQISLVGLPATGQFCVHLDEETTRALSGTWVYDIRITTKALRLVHLTSGVFEVLPSVI